MELKKLEKPMKLQIYESLRKRRAFTSEEEYDCGLIEKGYYNGEVIFNELAVRLLDHEVLMISDLVVNDSQWYQIDNIILTGRKLYLNEVKYLNGPLTYRQGDLYINQQKMKDDYLRKFNRVKELLEYSLARRGFNIEVIPHLIFMNPAMMFYGNSPELPILTHQQVEPFLKSIRPQGNNYSREVAEFLLSMHAEVNPFERMNLSIARDNLRPGIRCSKCGLLDLRFDRWKSHCQACGKIEFKSGGVKRNIEEFQILYPDEKLTAINIYRWCDEKVSLKPIRKILNGSHSNF